MEALVSTRNNMIPIVTLLNNSVLVILREHDRCSPATTITILTPATGANGWMGPVRPFYTHCHLVWRHSLLVRMRKTTWNTPHPLHCSVKICSFSCHHRHCLQIQKIFVAILSNNLLMQNFTSCSLFEWSTCQNPLTYQEYIKGVQLPYSATTNINLFKGLNIISETLHWKQ